MGRHSSEGGLTRLELLSLLGAVALLAGLALPLLANTPQRSDRVVCISNLQRIGQAFHAWGMDHEDRMFWNVEWSDQGTKYTGGGPAPPWAGQQVRPYFQYAWVSNELIVPKILVCPADTSKHAAVNWGFTDPAGGFRHSNQQENSISYDLWLHSGPGRPSASMCSDRNLSYDGISSACSTGITPTREVRPASTVVEWLPSIHPTNGNVLLYDGRVAQVDTAGVRQLLLDSASASTNGEQEHYLFPQ
jgi:hypothetical protein